MAKHRLIAAGLASLTLATLAACTTSADAQDDTRRPAWMPAEPPPGTPMESRVVPIVDCGADYLRDGDGRPRHQFHVHRYALERDEATGLIQPAGGREHHNSVDLDGDGEADDSMCLHPFSLERPLSPTTPWYDSLAGNPRWFGGAVLRQYDLDSTNFSEDGVNHEHDGPRHYPRDNWALFHENYEIYSTYTLRAAWVWKKEDFLSRGDTGTVTFDKDSTLRLYLQRYWMGIDGARWLVRDGDQFYLSEAVFRGAGQVRGSGNGKQHVICPLDTKWAPWDPTANDLSFDAEDATFAEHEFGDVTAVGVYIYKDRPLPAYFGYKWYAFEADAVVAAPKLPSEHIAMTAMDGGEGPAYHLSRAVPYELWKNIYRRARSNTFVTHPRGYNFVGSGHPGRMGPDTDAYLEDPVERVHPHDMALWCNALSEFEGRTPCFYEDPEFKTVYRQAVRSPLYSEERPPLPDLYVNWAADGYRPATWAEAWPHGAPEAVHGWRLVRREAGLPAPDRGYGEEMFNGRDLARPWGTETKPGADLVATLPVPGLPVAFGKTEVSYRQWHAVRDWAHRQGYTFDQPGDMGSMDWWGFDGYPAARKHTPDDPVTNITYYDAVVWCNALSESQGLQPVYYEDAEFTQVYKNAFVYRPLQMLFFEAQAADDAGVIDYSQARAHDTVHIKAEADGYRLPTEDEFERARTAGKGRYSWGNAPEGVFGHAWLFDAASQAEGGVGTRPVGTLEPNAVGLHDMEGNVNEMVEAGQPWQLVRCGGSFQDLVVGLRGGGAYGPTGWGYPDLGFRVVKQAGRRMTAASARNVFMSVLPGGAGTEDFDVTLGLNADPAKFDPLQGRVFRANLLRTGVHEAKGLRELTGQKWKFQTGGPVKSSPIVVDGTLYVGSWDGHIYALDAQTGQERWKFETGGRVSGSATVMGGICYMASEDGKLYALDARTGEKRWEQRLHPRTKPTCSPAVAWGTVFMPPGATGGSTEVMMSAFDCLGFDAATGDRVWTGKVSPQGFAGVCIDGERIYAGVNGSSYGACDPASGRQLWAKWTGHQDRQFACMARAGEYVYIVGTIAGSVNAHDPKTGMPVWQSFAYPDQVSMNNGGEPGYEIFTSPALAHGRVYVGCNDGKLYTFDMATGERGWTFETGGRVHSSPAVAGKVVYFGSWDGKLYAVDAETGAGLWSFEAGDRIISGPWPMDDAVYFGCDDGAVYGVSGK